MKKLLVNSGLGAVALVVSSVPALAQTAGGDAATAGATAGFAKLTAIQDMAIPLLIALAATLVAAFFVIRLIRRA